MLAGELPAVARRRQSAGRGRCGTFPGTPKATASVYACSKQESSAGSCFWAKYHAQLTLQYQHVSKVPHLFHNVRVPSKQAVLRDAIPARLRVQPCFAKHLHVAASGTSSYASPLIGVDRCSQCLGGIGSRVRHAKIANCSSHCRGPTAQRRWMWVTSFAFRSGVHFRLARAASELPDWASAAGTCSHLSFEHKQSPAVALNPSTSCALIIGS